MGAFRSYIKVIKEQYSAGDDNEKKIYLLSNLETTELRFNNLESQVTEYVLECSSGTAAERRRKRKRKKGGKESKREKE